MRTLTLLTAALLAISLYFISAPASAIENGDPFSTGDSNGPRQPRAYPSYGHGTEDQTNHAWRDEAYARADAVGPWGDGVLPVEYAAQAWNGLVGGGRNPNPSGGPVGASIGGSD